jgi:death-on-curing protein
VIYLDVEDFLHIAQRTLATVETRDIGLLASAAARPQASAFGVDAYPSVHEKAAALVHSIARTHALVDGNKRLALAAGIAFLGVNGRRLTMSNDEAYQLIMIIATSELDEIGDIAADLRAHTRPRQGSPDVP